MRRNRFGILLVLPLFAAGLRLTGTSLDVEAADTNIMVWGEVQSHDLAPPPPGTDHQAIAAGDHHALALKSDGSLVAWGDNTWGQTDTPAGNDYIAVAAGDLHSLALRADGSIVGWGLNEVGQATPPAGNDFTAIAAGIATSVALRSDGSIVAWGSQWGPQPPAGDDYVKVAAYGQHFAALTVNGAIAEWGDAYSRPTSDNFVDIAVGPDWGVAIWADRQIQVWGPGAPIPPQRRDYAAVAAGRDHGLALTVDGSIVAWGQDLNGEATPPGGVGYTAIAAGDSISAALQVESPSPPQGEFTPLTPARVLDTRTGNGRDGAIGPLGESRSFEVQITGRGGVATSGVSSVVMNVTVAEPTLPSHLVVWPAGFEMPDTSNVNYVPGQTVPNLVTVRVGDGGRVRVFNAFGTTHVIFDVVGYYADEHGPSGSRFRSLAPARVFDTRDNTGGVGVSPLGPDQTLEFNLLGRGGVPASGVTAVVMNVTVTQPTEASHLTVYPGDVAPAPTASNLNYSTGLTVPNLVVVRVPTTGIVRFHNAFGNVHVLADVVGYYDNDRSTEAGRFVGLVPSRAFDSRWFADGAWGPDEWFFVGDFPGFGGLPFGVADAVLVNVTAAGPTQASYLTVFPSDNCSVPYASNLNFTAGRNVGNQVIVRLSATEGCAYPTENETISIYNLAGQTEVIVDVFGLFTSATWLAALQ